MSCTKCKSCTSRFCPNCGACINGDIPDQIISRLENAKRTHRQHIKYWDELNAKTWSYATPERKAKEIASAQSKLDKLDTMIEWVKAAAKKGAKA